MTPRPHARFRPHGPARPSYRCRGCGAHWPCQPSRLNLLARFRGDPGGLVLHLAEYFFAALDDIPSATPGELIQRFYGWIPAHILDPDRRP